MHQKEMYAKGYQHLVKMGQAAKESAEAGAKNGNGAANGNGRDRAQSATPSVSGDAPTPVSVRDGTPSPSEAHGGPIAA